MSDHERIEELLALEALDALELEGEEALAREVEAHGPDCEACAVLRREYRNAAGRLPFALDPVAVRDELGEDILKAGRPVLLARPAGPLRGRRLRALFVAAAAAAFAALGAVGGYVLAPRQDTEAAVLEATLNVLNGKIEDKEAFMKAVRAIKVDTVRGPVQFDQYGNIVGNVYIRKVERKGGKLVNTVVKTYPQVSQFWTYDPKQFLSNPVYSREFPPAKHLEP